MSKIKEIPGKLKNTKDITKNLTKKYLIDQIKKY